LIRRMVMLPLQPALPHVQQPPPNHQETMQVCEQVILNSRDDSALFVVSYRVNSR